jgi:hypothetical protein
LPAFSEYVFKYIPFSMVESVANEKMGLKGGRPQASLFSPNETMINETWHF